MLELKLQKFSNKALSSITSSYNKKYVGNFMLKLIYSLRGKLTICYTIIEKGEQALIGQLI